MTQSDHDHDPQAARLAEVDLEPEMEDAFEADEEVVEDTLDTAEDDDLDADLDVEAASDEDEIEESSADEDSETDTIDAETAEDEDDTATDDDADAHRQIATAMSPADRVRMVEAILFASAEPVADDELKSRLPEDSDLDVIVSELQALYEPRGVNLVQVAGKWAFRTAPDMGFLLQQEKTEPRKLSRAAIETLAIIAYHQPVTRAEIEELRGVTVSKGTLDVLLDVGWVRMRGRRPVPGRPITYGTSDDFLEHFGLAGIGDLPGMEELKAAGLLDWRLPPDFSVPVPPGEGDGDGDGDFGEEEPELDLDAAAEAAAMSEEELFEVEGDDEEIEAAHDDDADGVDEIEDDGDETVETVGYDDANEDDYDEDDYDADDGAAVFEEDETDDADAETAVDEETMDEDDEAVDEEYDVDEDDSPQR